MVMKGASSEESQTVMSNGPTDKTVSVECLVMQPWKFWEQREKCDSLLRSSLVDSFKAVVELRRRKAYIKDEISKKRSRRSAAVQRAIAASKRDANRIGESVLPLEIEELWTCLESENSSGIKPLNEALESILSSQPASILREDVIVLTEKGKGSKESDGKGNRKLLSQGEGSEDNTAEEYYEEEGDFSEGNEDILRVEDADTGSDDEAQENDESSAEAEEEEEYDGSGSDSEKEVGDGAEIDRSKAYDSVKEKSKLSAKSLNDRFFNFDAMEDFADQEFNDADDGFNYFESMGEESDNSKSAEKMMYRDFFDDPNNIEDDDDSNEEDEVLHCSRDLTGLDEDEREMELLLQKVEDEEGSDEDESEHDDTEQMDFKHMMDMQEEVPDDTKLDDKSDNEISRLEKELISQKHWSLMGEASARKRPRNSLLDLDLELPQNSLFIHVDKNDVEATDEQERDVDGEVETQDMPIEIIIQQRIKAEVFDNVERKIPLEDQLEAIERLKQRRNKVNNEEVQIDFSKDKTGLGDVYARRYEEMFMATDKLDDHKKKLAEDFGKLIFKLDSLCNCNIIPKRVSEAEKSKDVALITVEAPMNVVTASRHTDDGSEKMEGNKITRNAKKRKFTNKLKGLLKSGKATIEDINRIKQRVMQKGKERIQDARDIKLTGLTKEQEIRERKRSNRRVNITELMSRTG